MGFDIKGNRSSGIGGGIILAAPQPQFDKICGGLNIEVNTSVMDVDTERNDHVKKPSKPSPNLDKTTLSGESSREEESAAPAATDNDTNDDTNSTTTTTFKTKEEDAANTNNTTVAETVFNSKISFPLNLTRMLEAVEGMGKLDIVHWAEDGKSFIIVDIDAFLREVLPKFFKSGENTKIRSFYRKLNRWGFSMSRKRANNPLNIWSHPAYDRTIALRALKDALEHGKAVDFLNMSSISRARKRRVTASSKEGGESNNSLEEDEMNHGLDGSFTTIDGSFTTIDGASIDGADSLLSRSRSQSSWVGGNLGSIASMPVLPSARISMSNSNERGRMSHSVLSSRPMLQQQQQQKRQLSHRFTSSQLNNLQRAQTTQILGQRGSGNATFDLIRPPQGSSNFNFDLVRPSQQEEVSNSMLDLSALTQGGFDNTTFDLSALFSLPSTNNFAPSSNIFALNAQEMLNSHSSTSSHNIDRLVSINAPNNVTMNNSNKSPFSREIGTPHRRQDLQNEMSREEDNELTDFFGTFAEELPPPKEDDEECGGEPDPLP